MDRYLLWQWFHRYYSKGLDNNAKLHIQDYIKLKSIYIANKFNTMKRPPVEWEKYLQTMY